MEAGRIQLKDRVTDELSLASNRRTPIDAATIVVLAYLGAVAVAEVMSVFVGAILGTLAHAILIPTMLSHYALSEARYRRVLPVLALAPLLRLLSLTMPIKQLPQIYWYALVGVPLLLAVGLVAQLLDLSWSESGLRFASWRPQVLMAASGLPLSVAAFLILPPNPLASRWWEVAIGSVILVLFTGFVEEIIFRGLLQQVIAEVFGQIGILYSSILFAVMYIGSLSAVYVLFVGLTGLFFSWCVNRTGSIWGVVVAHSLISVGTVFIWPLPVNGA